MYAPYTYEGTNAKNTEKKAEFPENFPLTLAEAMKRAVGKKVKCELLMGMKDMVALEGTLTEVGSGYFTISDLSAGKRIYCDIHSLKFLTVYEGKG